MRGIRIALVFVLLSFGTGCNLVKLISYNAYNETTHYFDNLGVTHRALKLAEESWVDYYARHGGSCADGAFKDGYITGFADFLDYGGNGAPPAMPPAKYRRKRNLDPEGHEEIGEYYLGFAAGAKEAKASGLRQYFLIPLSTPLAGPPTETALPPNQSHLDVKEPSNKPEAELLPQPMTVPMKPSVDPAPPKALEPPVKMPMKPLIPPQGQIPLEPRNSAERPSAFATSRQTGPEILPPTSPRFAEDPPVTVPATRQNTTSPEALPPAYSRMSGEPPTAIPTNRPSRPETKISTGTPYNLILPPQESTPVQPQRPLPLPEGPSVEQQQPLPPQKAPSAQRQTPTERPVQSLPREFSLPNLGGPASR
ncbi:MAG: hypothetical protein K8T89_19180 [Planctomycetes bacterium]|nr:hypothetical protein [Planctomycetota bacterium]